MALIHDATLSPTKLELLSEWLPSREWCAQDPAAPLERAGAFRFDDPAGEVGVEILLVCSGDALVQQVPLTYRAEPFAAGEGWLIGTMEHSVLGQRWVYDATGDPVYVAALAATILGGGTQAPEYLEVDGRQQARAVLAEAVGSGSSSPDLEPIESVAVETVDGITAISAGALELSVLRTPGSDAAPLGAETLTGTWAGQTTPVLLAYAVER